MTKTASDPTLDFCACCDDGPPAPETDNPAGQEEILFRLGTHAVFMDRMTRALPGAEVTRADGSVHRPLAALTTRAPDDPSVALLDACATVCDIITFYQERIANEGFLRTATERRSVLELARAIGYELNPGVAASTWLAFTVEDPPPAPLVPAIPGLPQPPPPIIIPSRITIAAGTRVQSVPQGQSLPQTFETSADVEARVGWNAMRARTRRRQYLSIEKTELMERDPAGAATSRACGTIWLAGTSTGLTRGDLLVVQVTDDNIDPSQPISAGGVVGGATLFGQSKGLAMVTVAAVTADDVNRRTRVDLVGGGDTTPPFAWLPLDEAALETEPLPQDADTTRARILEGQWDEALLAAFLDLQGWDEQALVGQVAQLLAAAPSPANVFVFRARVGLFGNAAPPSRTIIAASTTPPWPDYDASSTGTPATAWQDTDGTIWIGADLYLERTFTGLAPGELFGLSKPGDAAPTLFAISSVTEQSLAEFAMSGKATGLRLFDQADQARPLDEWTTPLASTSKTGAYAGFAMRTTTAHLHAEALALAEAPIDEPVGAAVVSEDGVTTWSPATNVMLEALVPGLRAGAIVAIAGSTVDANGVLTGATAREVATLDAVTHVGGYTVLAFVEPLAAIYARSSFTVCANVAAATHGETQPLTVTPDGRREEILGNGDGSVANQSFALKKAPLTWVSAATPSGGASTVTVRVNGVEWDEVPSLYGLGPTDRVYTLRGDDDGTTFVQFGDGISGARVPTGRSNVTASYRAGIGLLGEVGVGELTLLQSRPLGLKGVVNPVEASGAQDPEELDDARTNAPRTVRTLERIVSVADVEDFARGFAGVGKAQAVEVWSGQRRQVALTVATSSGDTVDETSELYANLLAAIAASADPSLPVLVQGFAPRFFQVAATIVRDPAYLAADVTADATAAIEEAFAFAARGFAQPVTEAELIALLQELPGVVASQVTALHRADEAAGHVGVLAASPARHDAATRTVLPAELLLLARTGLALTVVTS